MGRLFLKIFLWFWAAMFILSATVWVVSRWFNPVANPDWWNVAGERILHAVAVDAAAFRKSGREEELERLLESIRAGGLQVWVQFEDGALFPSNAPPTEAVVAIHNAATAPNHWGWDPPFLAQRAEWDGMTVFVTADLIRPPLFALALWRDQAWALLLVFGFSGLICYLLAHHFARPLRRFAWAAERVAGGDLAVRLTPEYALRRDELADLARTFDHMVERVAGLLRSQQMLLAGVSHEIRSPLTRIRLALELIPEADGADRSGRERVVREVNRIDAMITRLLRLVRVEVGVREPAVRLIRLDTILREVRGDVVFETGLEREADLQLTHVDPARIMGEPGLLRTALENVLRNALQYSPRVNPCWSRPGPTLIPAHGWSSASQTRDPAFPRWNCRTSSNPSTGCYAPE
ncbi:MAG: ATP-binding protein [Acidobacteriota bacterium]